MSIEFVISTYIPVPPQAVYDAWLDSAAHSAMTGGAARVNAEVGGSFEAWDGYIQGVNLELEPGARILQTWRTSEFEEDDPDSRLEVRFEEQDGGTRLILHHFDLPAHGMQYQQGWVDNYFEPMQAYFGE